MICLELLYELTSIKRREELRARLSVLRELVDWVDIPDSPMGSTSQFSPLVSCLVKVMEEVKVIAHVRTIDLSRVALTSAMRSLELCGVERVVYVRGDLVPDSSVVKDVEPEDAVSLVKRLGLSISPGLTLSLRKDLTEILKRMSSGADFYLILNLTEKNTEVLERVSRIARSSNVKIYPYLIVATENNYGALVKLLGREKVFPAEKALEIASSSCHLVDGFLVSSPLDFKGGINFLNALRKVV
ncbi:MAG: methylenetetrahydrofolate reductase [Sulfolobales archaeon]